MWLTGPGAGNFFVGPAPVGGVRGGQSRCFLFRQISTCDTRYVRRINSPVHSGCRDLAESDATFKKQHSHARKTWLVFSQTMSPRTLTRTCLPAAGKTAGSLRGYCTGQPNPRTLRQQPKSVRPTTGSSHSLTKETLSREQSGLNHVTV